MNLHEQEKDKNEHLFNFSHQIKFFLTKSPTVINKIFHTFWRKILQKPREHHNKPITLTPFKKIKKK